MIDTVPAAWRTSNQVTVFLVDHIPADLWAAPRAAIAFNTTPHDSADAAARWLPGGGRGESGEVGPGA